MCPSSPRDCLLNLSFVFLILGNECTLVRWRIYVSWLCVTSSTNCLYFQGRDDSDYQNIVDKLNNLNFRLVLILETIPLLAVQVILIKTTTIETQVLDWIIIAEVV